MADNQDKKPERLSFAEQTKLYLKLVREGKVDMDTDELPLPMLPSIIEKLKAGAHDE